jgi:HEAT repeat protein
MGSRSSTLGILNGANAATLATFACAATLAFLLLFIVARRMIRARYFRRYDTAARRLRRRWPEMLASHVMPECWRSDKLTCTVALDIALDSLEQDESIATNAIEFLRRTALLDQAIYAARHTRTSQREPALLRVARTRAPEALPLLVDALHSALPSTRMAAVQALGRTGLPQAVAPLLEAVILRAIVPPPAVLKQALVNCCRGDPTILVPYIRDSKGPEHELVCQVAGEIADDRLADELILLVDDRAPEVRAAAARALHRINKITALPLLAELSMDDAWFVRLRAVMSLAVFHEPEARDALIRTLCDTNRLVRQRSAAALCTHTSELPAICVMVAETGDKYALQALVSHLERCGTLDQVMAACAARGLANATSALERAVVDLRESKRSPFAFSAAVH